jgi:hypothetical protein
MINAEHGVYAYNPSYLGGRDRRITSLRPAWATLAITYIKNKVKTKGLRAWLKW